MKECQRKFLINRRYEKPIDNDIIDVVYMCDKKQAYIGIYFEDKGEDTNMLEMDSKVLKSIYRYCKECEEFYKDSNN